MLDVRRLEVLLAVLDFGSFTDAAFELGLTQPAVSHSVKSLERHLGQDLVVRDRNGIRATPAGTLLAQHARAIVSRLSLAELQVGNLARPQVRRLRVGAFGSALSTLLPKSVHDFAGHHDSVVVETVEGRTDDLLDQVREGTMDLAIGYDDANEPSDCTDQARTDLQPDDLHLTVWPGHRVADRARVHLDELSEERWLVPRPDHLIIRSCRRAGFEPRVVAWSADPSAIRTLVEAQVAITLTPSSMVSALAPLRPIELAEPVRRRIFAVTASPVPELPRDFLASLIRVSRQRTLAA